MIDYEFAINNIYTCLLQYQREMLENAIKENKSKNTHTLCITLYWNLGDYIIYGN